MRDSSAGGDTEDSRLPWPAVETAARFSRPVRRPFQFLTQILPVPKRAHAGREDVCRFCNKVGVRQKALSIDAAQV